MICNLRPIRKGVDCGYVSLCLADLVTGTLTYETTSLQSCNIYSLETLVSIALGIIVKFILDMMQ